MNLVSPTPITQKEFSLLLAKEMNKMDRFTMLAIIAADEAIKSSSLINNNTYIDFNKTIYWYQQFKQKELINFALKANEILSYKNKFKSFVKYLNNKS